MVLKITILGTGREELYTGNTVQLAQGFGFDVIANYLEKEAREYKERQYRSLREQDIASGCDNSHAIAM